MKTTLFVLGHYLFLEAHSFPRATLSENCLLLGTEKMGDRGIRYHVVKNQCEDWDKGVYLWH